MLIQNVAHIRNVVNDGTHKIILLASNIRNFMELLPSFFLKCCVIRSGFEREKWQICLSSTKRIEASKKTEAHVDWSISEKA